MHADTQSVLRQPRGNVRKISPKFNDVSNVSEVCCENVREISPNFTDVANVSGICCENVRKISPNFSDVANVSEICPLLTVSGLPVVFAAQLGAARLVILIAVCCFVLIIF